LRLAGSGGADTARELHSAECTELTSALALVAAVVLNPRPPSEPASEPPSSPASPEQTASRVTVRTSLESPVAGSPRPVPMQPRRRPRVPWSLVGLLGLGLKSGPAPDLLWTPWLGLGVDSAHDSSGWGLSVRLVATQARSGTVRRATGDAELTWTVARVDGCASYRAAGWITLAPCAVFEAGLLRGAGNRASGTVSRGVAWLAPGVLARGNLRRPPKLIGVHYPVMCQNPSDPNQAAFR
jgi:hypothetical protein